MSLWDRYIHMFATSAITLFLVALATSLVGGSTADLTMPLIFLALSCLAVSLILRAVFAARTRKAAGTQL